MIATAFGWFIVALLALLVWAAVGSSVEETRGKPGRAMRVVGRSLFGVLVIAPLLTLLIGLAAYFVIALILAIFGYPDMAEDIFR